jgi:hypothetical protein
MPSSLIGKIRHFGGGQAITAMIMALHGKVGKSMSDLLELFTEFQEIESNIHADKKEMLSEIIRRTAVFCINSFQTENDEVAIFLANADHTVLSFVYPPYLVDAKPIEVGSNLPVVSRIFRTGKSLLDNNFLEQERLYQYEFVKGEDYESKLIWKIMGAVISQGSENLGVIQISRKRAPYTDVGDDFSEDDLKRLEELAGQVAPVIKTYLD